MGEERPAPRGLGVADAPGDDLGRQPAHGTAARVEEPGLAGQGVAVGGDAHDVAGALAQSALREHVDLGAVPVEVVDLPAQATGAGAGVELGLDDDAAGDDVQPAAEAQQGGHLGAPAARLGDREPAEFVLDRCGHGHLRSSSWWGRAGSAPGATAAWLPFVPPDRAGPRGSR